MTFEENHSVASQIIEEIRAKNLEATLLFIDFSKAFDFSHKEKMEQTLLTYGLPKKKKNCYRYSDAW